MNQFNMKAILACLIVICSGVSGLKIDVRDGFTAFVASTGAANTKYFVTASGITGTRSTVERHCFVKGDEFTKLKSIMDGNKKVILTLVTGSKPSLTYYDVVKTAVVANMPTGLGIYPADSQSKYRDCTINVSGGVAYLLYNDNERNRLII